MDIVQCTRSQGKLHNFMDLVDPSMKESCEKYVKKCGGPYNVFRAEENKTPMSYLDEAFKPLQQFKDKVAIVIDGSTTRGFTEPSQASLYAQHLKMYNALCFDISEACNGWARATQLAYMYFCNDDSLKDKYILIINNEQPPIDRGCVPTDPEDYSQVVSYYVGMTFSNVCSFTLLKKSENHSWKWYNFADSTYASHISIGLPKIAEGFLPHTDAYRVLLNDNYHQFCLPRFHNPERKNLLFASYVESNFDFFKHAEVIPHTYTKTAWEKGFEFFKVKELTLYYPKTGNLASASLPWIIAEKHGGKLPKDYHMGFMGVAAGGSDIVVTFIQDSVQKQQKGSCTIGDKPQMNKYLLYAKLGLRVFFKRITCQKRQRDLQNDKEKEELIKKNEKAKVN